MGFKARKTISAITDEQEAVFGRLRRDWLDFVFSETTVINEKETIAGIRWIYDFCGFAAPEVAFVRNPLELQLVANERAADLQDIGEHLYLTIINSLLDKFTPTGVEGALLDSRIEDYELSLQDELDALLVWHIVRDETQARGLRYFEQPTYLNFNDVDVILQHDFFEHLGVKQPASFYRYRRLVRSGIYESRQFDGLCIVCPYPKRIRVDGNWELHSDDGPAIRWHGYELSFRHGEFVA